jgi:hypothetical protein
MGRVPEGIVEVVVLLACVVVRVEVFDGALGGAVEKFFALVWVELITRETVPVTVIEAPGNDAGLIRVHGGPIRKFDF